MPVFTVTGDEDPFLHVTLRHGEKIYCEANAMVMMESSLELKGKMNGGLGAALMRTFANGESFFQQHIEATKGDGDCLLAPTLPGAMQVLDVGPRQYMISDGAFVAASSGVDLNVRTQNVGNALFGQTGGFFITETSGSGQLVVSGFGSVATLDVVPGKEVTIDNSHVVCWDSSLRYEISVATSRSSGFLGNLVNSVTSGEGMVLRFSGSGKVVVCSRSRAAFLAWLSSTRPQ
ncbi:uncharacterized protein (TIGR00266 family) [Pseudoduganella flava]|uniref:TIGR00266 family protein n=1 Tax=Pseudoduganella flava TaxID=871742 RepID=A0A562Q591_9BURK|nr:TIGR00266 family protein [Pseudoduganella flava]QGZ41259.1 TIGR00266 family protein [Pseudoduganella flava]TWI51196.1 uncharacterized protein (TIGR00266 family) [Pseudoduganella flava]